ncbi:NCS2 family permease [Spiroplasma endosymbiont of Crioceris asparagi]|uniref:NCS2 family permease n=1 Tax=Spiroplasma endosymbiont of Crioceris asparagi TaxID=3066286 RepID=UPI0030CED080
MDHDPINFRFSKFKAVMKIEKYFQFDKLQTTFKKEIIGGVSTFLAMVYILTVNPALLGSAASINSKIAPMNIGATTISLKGVFLATTLSTFLATMIMGLFANVPVAVSTSMGLNVFFTYTLANSVSEHNEWLGYEGALIAVMISSFVFLIFSITPLRYYIIQALPKSLIIIMGVSIGLFIAYIGFADMGWFKMNGGLPNSDLSRLKTNYPMILIGMLTLGIMIFLNYKKVSGAVIIAIIIGFIISIIVANVVSKDSNIINQNTSALFNSKFDNIKDSFKHYSDMFVGFKDNMKNTFSEFGNSKIWKSPTMYVSIFIIFFLNFFDATGTLTAVTVQVNKTKNTELTIPQKALVVDSAATVIGSALCTSPMGAFIESNTGVQQGARSGFASLITGLLFLLAVVVGPIFQAIPQCVTSAACIFVGMMMISEIDSIEWKKPEFGISALFSIIFMLATYNIANGVAMSIMIYVFIMIVTGKIKEINKFMYLLCLIFLLYFIGLSTIQ